MSDKLAAAYRAANWPAALDAAIALWRDTRATAVADLVDAIAGKLPGEKPPAGAALHAWWIARAKDPAASDITALVESGSARGGQSDGVTWGVLRNRYKRRAAAPLLTKLNEEGGYGLAFRNERLNVLERFAALLEWRDDPRVASLLATWLVDAPFRWEPIEHGNVSSLFYRAVADHLAQLGDARVIPRLRACVKAPTAPTKTLRTLQQTILPPVIAAIEKRAKPLDADTAALVAELAAQKQRPFAPKTRSDDEAALWRAVAEQPTELAPRSVLGDFLQERGDARGELIAAQLAGDTKRATRLVNRHWAAWLGDLALVANRKGTELRNGMLEVIRVGTPKTPEWAFAKVAGHRELATVHTVLPGHVRPEHYAIFLRDPTLNISHLGIDVPEIVDALAKLRRKWRVREITYAHDSVRERYRYDYPPLASTFAKLAKLAPDLEIIRFGEMMFPTNSAYQLRQLAPTLPSLFPQLKRVIRPPT